AIRDYHYRRPLAQDDSGDGGALFLFAFNSAHRRRRIERSAAIAPYAPLRRRRLASFHLADRHCRLRHLRIRGYRLPAAVFTDTHPQDLCCLPHRLWYSHFAFDVPPQVIRATSARASCATRSCPSPERRRLLCAY